MIEKGNPIAHHQFPEAGVFKVNLLVQDTSKLWARIQKEVVVNLTDTMIVPVLRIEPEFPSDRDTPFDYQKIIRRVFPEPGVYKVTMQIMDTGELKDIAVVDGRESELGHETDGLRKSIPYLLLR